MADRNPTTTGTDDNVAKATYRRPGDRPHTLDMTIHELRKCQPDRLLQIFHDADDYHTFQIGEGGGEPREEDLASDMMDLTRSLMISERSSDEVSIVAKVKLVQHELECLRDNEDHHRVFMLLDSILLDYDVIAGRASAEAWRERVRREREAGDA